MFPSSILPEQRQLNLNLEALSLNQPTQSSSTESEETSPIIVSVPLPPRAAATDDSIGRRSIMAVNYINNIKSFRMISSKELKGAKGGNILIEAKEKGSEPEVYHCVTSATKKFFNAEYTLVSVGCSTDREIISLGPVDTEKELNYYYKQLKESFTERNYSNSEVLFKVMEFVKKKVFLGTNLDRVISEATRVVGCKYVLHEDPLTQKKTGIPIIPLYKFLKFGLGVCRHHSLTVSYLLYRLTLEEKPLISGRVKHMRDFVKGGAHAWVAFIPKKIDPKAPQEKWLIDSLSGIVSNFALEDKIKVLKQYYDPTSEENRKNNFEDSYSPIDNMIRKTSAAAKENGQEEFVSRLDTDDEKTVYC